VEIVDADPVSILCQKYFVIARNTVPKQKENSLINKIAATLLLIVLLPWKIKWKSPTVSLATL